MDINLVLQVLLKYGPEVFAGIMAIMTKGGPSEQDWLDFAKKVEGKTFDDFQKGPVAP